MVAGSGQRIFPRTTEPLRRDEEFSSATCTTLVPKPSQQTWSGGPGGTYSARPTAVLNHQDTAPHCDPLTTVRHYSLGRRTFLQGTAACPVLLITLSPVAALATFSTAPRAAGTAESWQDKTFWDDGTGWV
jgi:hypothetical protein